VAFPQSFDLPPIGRIGSYDVLGRIASGGMSDIFLGRSIEGELVVVKRILSHASHDKRFRTSLEQEANLLLGLEHPGLCRIIELGNDDGMLFVAMELVHGVDLRKLTQESGGSLPIEIASRIAADVAAALHHAHHAVDANGRPMNVIHRDVTPENILIGFDGHVKLLDFGIAKATTHVQMTQQGELKGKFPYMPPEQYEGRPLDGRADVFALGACLYEALVGVSLFDRPSEFETVAAIVSLEPAPLVRAARDDVPVALEAIVARALAKKRQERFLSAREIRDALETFLEGRETSVTPQELSEYTRALFPQEAFSGPNLDRAPLRRSVRDDETGRPRDITARVTLSEELDEAEREIGRSASRRKVAIFLVFAVIFLGAVAMLARGLAHPS
jgi:serine/threonine protein kinase